MAILLARNRHQLSRKGISMVFVYLTLLLVTVLSGLIVYFMSSSLMNDYILRTLGLRLTLHGLTLYTNTIYSMPSGRIEFVSSFPSSCEPMCVDCAFKRTLLFFKDVFCNCTNGFKEIGDEGLGGNILNVRYVDEEDLVCDGNYIVNSLEPVILFVGREPVSAGFRADLTIYPDSLYFRLFRDEITSRFGDNIEFFDSNIYVFTEMPINLNDYALVRRLLTDAPTSDFKELIGDPDAGWIPVPPMLDVSLYKKTYDNFESTIAGVDLSGGVYESISEDTIGVSGLMGILDAVFRHSSNTTIIDNSYLEYYCFDNSEEEDSYLKGVLCPKKAASGAGEYSYKLTIRPGLKIVQTGSELCEYECYDQNSLESTCPSGVWHEVFCFDFETTKDYPCDECFADDVTYNIDLCDDDECIGTTSINYTLLEYTNIYTGVQSFGDLSEALKLELDDSDKWPLSDDCRIEFTKVEDDTILQLIITKEDHSDDYDVDDCSSSNPAPCQIYADVYDTGDGLRVKGFDECDSKGVYNFSLSDPDTLADFTNIIEIEDAPSKTSFYSILTGDLSVKAQYKLFMVELSDADIVLEPTNETDVFTKMVKAQLGAIDDQGFIIKVSNPEMSSYITQSSCETAGFSWFDQDCFDPFTLNIVVSED